jgi:hypothetical protein
LRTDWEKYPESDKLNLVQLLIGRDEIELLAFCFDHGLKLCSSECINSVFVHAIRLYSLKSLDLLLDKGYKVDLLKIDYQFFVEKIVKDSRASSRLSLLSKVFVKLLLPVMIRNCDYKSFVMLEQKVGKIDPREVFGKMERKELFPFYDRKTQISIEILKRLRKNELKIYLKESVDFFRTNFNTHALAFAIEQGITP